MKRLSILISNAGSGTNLQAIIDAIKSNPTRSYRSPLGTVRTRLTERSRGARKLNAKIIVIISSDKDAYGLVRAKKNHIKTEICSDNKKLLALLKKYKPDYICLAGWKQIILPEVINAYPNKILNTHPGLIPERMDGVVKNPDGTDALWNKGKMTNKAMQNFLDNNATYAGCTNHFLSHEFDFGKVLGSCFEKIKKSDDVDSLYKRLKQKENKLYADVLKKLCN